MWCKLGWDLETNISFDSFDSNASNSNNEIYTSFKFQTLLDDGKAFFQL